MAVSRCANCAFEYFEVVKNRPHNSEVDLLFVQCVSCGAVLGLVNDSNDSILKLIEEQFSKAEKIATTLDHNIRIIAGKLGIK